jgi:hypothetical protein
MIQQQTKYQQLVTTPLKNKQTNRLGFAEKGSLRWPLFFVLTDLDGT